MATASTATVASSLAPLVATSGSAGCTHNADRSRAMLTCHLDRVSTRLIGSVRAGGRTRCRTTAVKTVRVARAVRAARATVWTWRRYQSCGTAQEREGMLIARD